MSALDALRARQLDESKPPSTVQLLKDAVLELATRPEPAEAELLARIEALETLMNGVLTTVKLQTKKPRKYKKRNPREDKGAVQADAPARVDLGNDLPPSGSPVPPPAKPETLGAGMAAPLDYAASLQTRPEND